jgi:protocatechuate 3,4-dioxygenase beta subunit
MRLTSLLVIALCLAAGDAYSQARGAIVPSATRIVRGVVIRAADDVPLGRARVTVSRQGTQAVTASVLTDARGEFVLTVSAEAAVSLRVSKAGYAATTLPLGTGRRGVPTDVRVAMIRGAAISGRAIDENGLPLSGALSLTLRRLGPNAGDAPIPMTMALDDRGEFRLAGLSAGRYVIGPPLTPRLVSLGTVRQVVVDLAAGSDVAADIVVVGPSTSLPRPATPPAAVPASSGIIRGRVIDTGGRPVAGATVSAKDGGRSRTVTTDGDGSFTLIDVPTGSVTVDATKPGYVASRHGAQTEQLPALPVALTKGQVVDGIDIVLPRTSAISGTVVDEAGEPIEDVAVQMLRITRSAGGGLVTKAAAVVDRRTDDRGQFRVWGIDPGLYVLTVSAPAITPDLSGSSRVAYAPVYYPGTTDVASAAQIHVIGEQDLSGFVVALAPVPVARISGVATNSLGEPLTGLIRLSSAKLSPLTVQPRQTTLGDNGQFAFTGVPRGEYLLHGLAATGPSGPEFAAHSVTVSDRDPPPLTVRTQPTSIMVGQLVLEGAPGSVLWDYSFNLVPVGPALGASANAKSSGAFSSGTAFRFTGLAGTARIVVSTPDEKWFLKSITVDGSDVADLPFEFGANGRVYEDVEVVFSSNGASIAGRVADERGTAVQHYAVIAFSADRDKWFAGSRWLKMARADRDGAFRLAALPPGDYLIAAVDRVEGSGDGGEWQDPELLRDLAFHAVRATLGERQSQTTSLRLIRR